MYNIRKRLIPFSVYLEQSRCVGINPCVVSSPDISGLPGEPKRRILPPFFTAMFQIYILYSASAGKYYIGHTDDVPRRIEEHNNVEKNTYTSQYRPWIFKGSVDVSESRGEARRVENYIKRMKSRKKIEKLIEYPEEFETILSMVRAIPMRRD
jgi:putative endonuclease